MIFQKKIKFEKILICGLVLFCIAIAPISLDILHFDIDEGIYIAQAELILQGKKPFKDFFHHQTPTYIYLLALWGKIFPSTLFSYRFLSLLATLISGVTVYLIVKRISDGYTGVIAA